MKRSHLPRRAHLRSTASLVLPGLACALALACSSGSDPTSSSPDGDAGLDSRDDVAAFGNEDALTSEKDGAGTDAATKDDAAVTKPNPPPGSIACGSGTFLPSEIADGCTSVLPELKAMPRSCGAASFTSGSWQAFCGKTSDEIYVYIRIDGTKGTATCNVKTPSGTPATFQQTVAPYAAIGEAEFGATSKGSISFKHTTSAGSFVSEATFTNEISHGIVKYLLQAQVYSCDLGQPSFPVVGGVAFEWARP